MSPIIGKLYKVTHSRKGMFTMRVTAINGEWISGVVGDSVAKAVMEYNVKYSGDEITVRDSHCSFTELEAPAEKRRRQATATNTPCMQCGEHY
jgi:hypothetical protein